MSFFNSIGNFFGGIASKTRDVFNNIGSKIKDTVSTIANKAPDVINFAENALHTVRQVADSPIGSAIASVLPYGSAIKQGLDTADNAISTAKQVNQFVQQTNKALQDNQMNTLQKANAITQALPPQAVNYAINRVPTPYKPVAKAVLER